VSRDAVIVWGLALRCAGRYGVKKAGRSGASSGGGLRSPRWHDGPKRGVTPRAPIRAAVGGQPQSARRFAHTEMAHIGGQYRPGGLEIRASTIPVREAVHGVRGPQGRAPWAMAPTAVGAPTGPEELPEGLIDGFAGRGAAMGRRKKDGVRRLRAHRVGVVGEALGERWWAWDQAVCAALALADGQDARLQIHRTAPSPPRFAHPQPTAGQTRQSSGSLRCRQGAWPVGRSRSITSRRRRTSVGLRL